MNILDLMWDFTVNVTPDEENYAFLTLCNSQAGGATEIKVKSEHYLHYEDIDLLYEGAQRLIAALRPYKRDGY